MHLYVYTKATFSRRNNEAFVIENRMVVLNAFRKSLTQIECTKYMMIFVTH